jgi:hypothetical protein
MAYRDDDGKPRYRFGYALAAAAFCAVAVTYLGDVFWGFPWLALMVYAAAVSPLLVNAWRKRFRRRR